LKAKSIVILSVIFVVIISALLAFTPSGRAAVLFPSDCKRIKSEAEEIFSDYGITDVTFYIEKTNAVSSMTHAYVLVAQLDEKPELSELYKIMLEMKKLKIKEYGSASNPYVIISECRIGNAKYSIYENTLHETGCQVYPETKPYVPSTAKETTTAKSSSAKKYYSSGSNKKSNQNDDYYNAKDYADPEDFYYDYYDDFDSYEDAEDYYNDYN